MTFEQNWTLTVFKSLSSIANFHVLTGYNGCGIPSTALTGQTWEYFCNNIDIKQSVMQYCVTMCMISHVVHFFLIASHGYATSGILIGVNVTESHVMVTCFEVAAPPQNACYGYSQVLVRSKQHCVARCEREETCLGVFMRDDGDRRVECILSQVAYSNCSELQQVRGDYNYAHAPRVKLNVIDYVRLRIWICYTRFVFCVPKFKMYEP